MPPDRYFDGRTRRNNLCRRHQRRGIASHWSRPLCLAIPGKNRCFTTLESLPGDAVNPNVDYWLTASLLRGRKRWCKFQRRRLPVDAPTRRGVPWTETVLYSFAERFPAMLQFHRAN